MLRGAQTPGELKQRTERLEGFADLAAVQEVLERLIGRGFVIRHPRRPGQKEDRYEQVLGGDDAVELVPPPSPPSAVDPRPGRRRGRPPTGADAGRPRLGGTTAATTALEPVGGRGDGAARSARSRPARPQRRDRAPARGARRLAPRRSPAAGDSSGRPARPLPAGDRGDQQGPAACPVPAAACGRRPRAAARSGASSRRSGGRCAGPSERVTAWIRGALWRRGVATL